MRESIIEKKVCDYAKSKSWLCLKGTIASFAGFPDRMMLRYGQVFFIEFKQEGKKATRRQRYVHRILRKHFFKVYVVDNIEHGINIIDEWGEVKDIEAK